ncbi:GNAT family N-acetyltransferase [Flammeovirgaceae bacterium SG7u.111]|nr:GNAT family N-acetyltransferase [Flammeovirgaceae bacterium SG7u.132]WPO36568.1 GNAT family N-acetyltransferase [Flammeovirgaceae bacterium SG7u.111]
MNENFEIRNATAADAPLVLDYIKRLAKYEKMLDEVEATEELVIKNVFEKKYAEVVIAELDGKPVGFALFFHNYSTFVGKPGLYLEDVFVDVEHRGKGFGKKLLAHLAQIAMERDCGRMEWSVLDWNEPSINFYKSLGTVPMDEWTVFRLVGDSLKDLAKE